MSGAADHFIEVVTRIAREEGFQLNTAKTRISQRSKQQRVLGIVVNDRANISRGEYDQLKAILHDAARNGPALANRRNVDQFDAYQLGRISWVASLNAERGQRLRRLFDQISWL
jgi:RNA-directed DNA polymerase